ncbi:MAG: hypothetical protein DI537_05125 [Stutzerimonas stutzeri]|nr:MAG: hypothetical protein DI537_05125 [Stutzerimonas stutzeri]
MRHFIGLDEQRLLREGREAMTLFEPERLLNSHVLMCGMSGTGKSFQSKRLLESGARAGIPIEVFDVHEELHDVYGARSVKYSQATGYGYNPLTLDTDPHVGGVNRQVDFFVGLIKEVSPQLGVKQESVLRNIVRDTFAAIGIYQNNPSTWNRLEITETERAAIIEARQWAQLRRYYPTLDDLRSYAMRKITALTIGGDNQAVGAYEQVLKLSKQRTRLTNAYNKTTNNAELEKLASQIELAQDKAVDAYSAFVKSIQTGREPEDIMKYDSVEVLNSVVARLDLLAAAGTFRANPPPFGSAQVKVHQIKALTTEQQVLFTKLRLRAIFEDLKKLGPTKSGTELRKIVFIDEAHKYFSKSPEDVLNVIAKEARKFGLGLWCASQQPTEFPESFLTNVGTTMLLGIHSSFWKRTSVMLRISEDELRAIRPKEVMAVKMMRDGEADPPFQVTIVPNPKTDAGRRAAAKMSPARAA